MPAATGLPQPGSSRAIVRPWGARAPGIPATKLARALQWVERFAWRIARALPYQSHCICQFGDRKLFCAFDASRDAARIQSGADYGVCCSSETLALRKLSRLRAKRESAGAFRAT